ncbi:hypothetical protein HPB51_016477 [Rhipicephalus microplus]|uniref:Uncharacterized protein n=1 Tax=Rhipicephalus microplus TaxID=6941 RepID=A0A9J6DPG3_RHIMP|nr:hypothetical protein HPB51_016477 [Rhipicephalus microplus]
MGKTNTVLIVFYDNQVPFHVYYRGAEYKGYLHKKRTDVYDKCWAVGHSSDVCPKPNAVICTLCGTANPATAHPCTLKCLLCGQAHQTSDKTCPQRYQTLRLLIYRRQEKAKLQQQQYLSTMISTQDAHPERQEVKPCDTPLPQYHSNLEALWLTQPIKAATQESAPGAPFGICGTRGFGWSPPSTAATQSNPRHSYGKLG